MILARLTRTVDRATFDAAPSAKPRRVFVDIAPAGPRRGPNRWAVRHGRQLIAVGRSVDPHGEPESYARQWHRAVHRERPLTIRIHDHERCPLCEADTVNA